MFWSKIIKGIKLFFFSLVASKLHANLTQLWVSAGWKESLAPHPPSSSSVDPAKSRERLKWLDELSTGSPWQPAEFHRLPPFTLLSLLLPSLPPSLPPSFLHPSHPPLQQLQQHRGGSDLGREGGRSLTATQGKKAWEEKKKLLHHRERERQGRKGIQILPFSPRSLTMTPRDSLRSNEAENAEPRTPFIQLSTTFSHHHVTVTFIPRKQSRSDLRQKHIILIKQHITRMHLCQTWLQDGIF